jgi:quercetin dioxygenase-like cupin family protein
MATIFNESSVASEPEGTGASRRRLLTTARVPGTAILLDRLTLAATGAVQLTIPATSVAWLQVLEGQGVLARGPTCEALTEAHIAFLPPGLSAGLSSARGAVLLYGEIPNAGQLDAGFADSPPPFRLADWTREPVLDSEHDARKRIYLVTPKLFGTKAVKGEMIIYPPGTAGANHHHEGGEHFMYVLRGRATVYANEQPFPARTGDVIYYPDRERHYLEAAADGEFAFAEFFAPAEHKTVWVNEAQVCTWLPTGRDIRGRTPAREIAAHKSNVFLSPEDV